MVSTDSLEWNEELILHHWNQNHEKEKQDLQKNLQQKICKRSAFKETKKLFLRNYRVTN